MAKHFTCNKAPGRRLSLPELKVMVDNFASLMWEVYNQAIDNRDEETVRILEELFL